MGKEHLQFRIASARAVVHQLEVSSWAEADAVDVKSIIVATGLSHGDIIEIGINVPHFIDHKRLFVICSGIPIRLQGGFVIPECVTSLMVNPIKFYSWLFSDRINLQQLFGVEINQWAHSRTISAHLKREFEPSERIESVKYCLAEQNLWYSLKSEPKAMIWFGE